jgi:hypothetical protein
MFKTKHGYNLNLDNPKSFNEKICRKKLYDRNPLLTLTADKYRAREYIRQKIGWEAENHLVPLLWVGKNPEEIPFNDLPDNYIIKPNNGAGRWILKETHYKDYIGDILNKENKPWINITFSIGREKPRYDISTGELIQTIKNWFKTIHGQEWNEWCYQNIDPLIIIEKVLYDKGDLALNYKFMMFSGKCKMIYVLDRNDIHLTMYDEDFNLLPVKRKGHPPGEIGEKPKNLAQMVSFAEKIAQPFDFVRCDFYVVEDYVYFGEMTHYPGSGHGIFEPKEYDLELGGYWK